MNKEISDVDAGMGLVDYALTCLLILVVLGMAATALCGTLGQVSWVLDQIARVMQ